MPSTKTANAALRNLPSIDELLRTGTAQTIAGEAGERHTTELCRSVIDQLRNDLVKPSDKEYSRDSLTEMAEAHLASEWQSERLSGVKRVINATGVVIHTNLGRAPLSEKARRAIVEEAAGYCSLEYDLATGKRGRRGRQAEEMLVELTGAEDVLIVNNCAAAAFFVLTVFASGGEVVISRGELVEIGGDFRVPDVLKQSRAKLHEVGTTNRTKLSDYENAIGGKTKLILRVHPSNYRIVGFTAAPTLAELSELAHRNDLLLYEALGSGALIDLAPFGIPDEPTVKRSIEAGVDIVTFSGDKLLGGPQAGIIAGKSGYVNRLRKHPLFRALRADKLAYAALAATLDSYRRGAASEVPVLDMLSFDQARMAERVEVFAKRIKEQLPADTELRFEVIDGVSAIGGGRSEEHTSELQSRFGI